MIPLLLALKNCFYSLDYINTHNSFIHWSNDLFWIDMFQVIVILKISSHARILKRLLRTISIGWGDMGEPTAGELGPPLTTPRKMIQVWHLSRCLQLFLTIHSFQESSLERWNYEIVMQMQGLVVSVNNWDKLMGKDRFTTAMHDG